VSATGRVIADHPEGFLQAERLMVPPGGGELILPSGLHAFAEVLGHEEAFIVRALHGTRGSRPVQHAPIERSWLAEEQSALRRVATLVARGMRKHRRRTPGHITVESFW